MRPLASRPHGKKAHRLDIIRLSPINADEVCVSVVTNSACISDVRGATLMLSGIGVVQNIALEYAEARVRVNDVCPGNLLDSPLCVNRLYKEYAKNQGISEAEVRE
jgi:NAD(P)-dependent dehydrogenase (short-subunit alcohol dehydrogenase family)